MTPPTQNSISAEALLKSLQNLLLEAARQSSLPNGNPPTRRDRQVMRDIERRFGPKATHYGRVLSDLVSGSYAWDLCPELGSEAQEHPRIYELCRCEPVLAAMRHTGELAEREALLSARNQRFVAFWRDRSITEQQRQYQTEAVYCGFLESVARIARKYRRRYEEQNGSAHGYIAPLPASRIRVSTILQPPLMALLFKACHRDRDTVFGPSADGRSNRLECSSGGNVLQLVGERLAEPTDTEEDTGPLRDWDYEILSRPEGRFGSIEDLVEKLDPMTWDLAAIAVSSYFARTSGDDPDAPFPFLIDDYFNWRDIDPRKRTAKLRQEIDWRIALLCSDRLYVRSETNLWLGGQELGRRRKTAVVAEGAFLVRRSRFYYKHASPAELISRSVPDGYVLSLGSWAAKFIEERAMLGVFFKRLAEYDLGRQQWERRIGWYLAFQMNNQASKMTFREVISCGRPRCEAEPQHPLRMVTVLAGSHVPWLDMRRTNPGKVIRQWCSALETLRCDGLISGYQCLDGAPDGSDLPARGRLDAMLGYRYLFYPGAAIVPHLRAKKHGASKRSARLPLCAG